MSLVPECLARLRTSQSSASEATVNLGTPPSPGNAWLPCSCQESRPSSRREGGRSSWQQSPRTQTKKRWQHQFN